MQRRPAVFLDRDGTLIEEVGHLSRPHQVQVYPQAFEAIRRINRSRRPAVVITNQSAVARGLLNEEQLVELHGMIKETFEKEGASIYAFYYCPHHPQAGKGPYTRACQCRKPQPGLLLQAAGELELDLASSYMVGDTLRDIEAGHRAGCRSILVCSGHGRQALEQLKADDGNEGDHFPMGQPDFVAEDLIQGVNWMLE